MKLIKKEKTIGNFRVRIDYDKVRLAEVNTSKYEDVEDTIKNIKKKFGGRT